MQGRCDHTEARTAGNGASQPELGEVCVCAGKLLRTSELGTCHSIEQAPRLLKLATHLENEEFGEQQASLREQPTLVPVRPYKSPTKSNFQGWDSKENTRRGSYP
jgi:hypothetical protein